MMLGDLTFDELQTLTAEALAAPWHRLRFPDRLEQLLDQQTDKSRLRYFILAISVGLCVFELFLVSDHQLIPDMFRTALILRAVCGPAILLATILLIRHIPPGMVREGLAVFPGIVAAEAIFILFLLTHSPYRPIYLNGMFLTVVYNNTIVQARFPAAVASTIIITALLIVAMALAPGDPWPIESAQLGIVLSVGIMTLMANFQLERERRRQYLLNLREKLANDALAGHNQSLRILSEQDGLTGAYNRRALDDKLSTLLMTTKTQHQAVGLIMIDVDHFKTYNDRFGHLAGDDCLRQIATVLINTTRNRGDMVARYGGEEFVVVVINATQTAVLALAERLRGAIMAQAIAAPQNIDAVMTASFGVAYCAHSGAVTALQCTCSASALLGRADEALYAAKQGGRNRVCAE